MSAILGRATSPPDPPVPTTLVAFAHHRVCLQLLVQIPDLTGLKRVDQLVEPKVQVDGSVLGP